MQVQKQISELLALRASEWLELLPNASDAQLREFEAWLSESRLHMQEFLEIAEIEFCLRSLDPQRRLDADSLVKRIAAQVVAAPTRATAGPFPANRSSPGKYRRLKIGGLAAAASLLLAVTTFFLVRDADSERYTTSVGEQRVVELPDTSVITLNADSQIRVRVGETLREIDLRRGEAIFRVAHDEKRPFRVRTRAGIVQAVGTQFNVHDRINGDTRVSVLEGKVRVVSTSGSELVLGVGEEADIRGDGTIARRTDAIVANTVAWRQHRLVFDNATIEEMAAEFNRYNQAVRLRLIGLEGDEHRFDGTFDATDPQSLATLLSRESDLTVERRDGEILIRKR
jgi:transmembrane sensor